MPSGRRRLEREGDGDGVCVGPGFEFRFGLRLRFGFGLFMVVVLRSEGLKLWFNDVVVVVLLLFFLWFWDTFRAQARRFVEGVGVDDPVTLVTGMAAGRAAALAGHRVALQAPATGGLVTQVTGADAVVAVVVAARLAVIEALGTHRSSAVRAG
jgi:hypothetical protein